MNTSQHEFKAEIHSTKSYAESAASVAVRDALERLQSGQFAQASQALQHALSVLAEPAGAMKSIVLDAHRFRQFAEATVQDDGTFESSVLKYPPRDEQSDPLDYFRGLVDFALTEQKHSFQALS